MPGRRFLLNPSSHSAPLINYLCPLILLRSTTLPSRRGSDIMTYGRDNMLVICLYGACYEDFYEREMVEERHRGCRSLDCRDESCPA